MLGSYPLLCLLASMQILLQNGIAQNCLQGGGTAQTQIPFEDLGGGSTRLPSGSQAIVTSYQFYCCGNITAWQTYVRPDGPGHRNGAYTIYFQVWRPTPTSGGGCYSLVGENRFPDIMFDMNAPISVTPQLSNRIAVMPGDVLGFFASSSDGGSEGIQMDPSFTNDEVFYADLGGNALMMGPEACPVSVGAGGMLSMSVNAAPVLSIDIDTYTCPPSPTQVPTSTPTPTTPPTTPPTTLPDTPLTTPLATPTTTPPDTTLPDEVTTQPTPGTDVVIAPTTPQTTEGPDATVVLQDSNPVDAGLVAGLIVVVLILIMAAVVITAFLLVRRNKKTRRASVNDFANPTYELSNRKGQTSLKEKLPLPPPQASTSDAVYSSIYNDFNYAEDPSSPCYASADFSTKKRSTGAGPSTGGVSTEEHSTVMANEQSVAESYGQLGPEYCDPNETGGSRNAEPGPYSEPFVGNQNAAAGGNGDTEAGLYSEPIVQGSKRGSAGLVVPSQKDRKEASPALHRKPSNYNKLNFVDTEIYWAPGATTSEIYDQLSSNQYREIPKNQIEVQGHLGSGQFGDVSKGLWTVSAEEPITIAIKQLLASSSTVDRVKLLQEAAIMGQFFHPNVVKLYGLITLTNPLMVCLEYMKHGDLRSYIEKMDVSKGVIYGTEDARYFFLRASREIANGMKYLSGKFFIHRDLAARNILLDESLTCKIGDFGMARDLMDDTYYTAHGGSMIPIKWTAPEALLYKKYSSDSDVWSYAMLLFEIWTVGKKPYMAMSNQVILRIIESGYCQPPPPGCPRAVYKLLVDCWNPLHQNRPKFGEICNYLQQPVSKLLYWSPRDTSLHPSVEELGAPLISTAKLYTDLQNKYKKTS